MLDVLNPVAVLAARWMWVTFMLSLLAPPVNPPLVRMLPVSEAEVIERLLGKPAEKPTGPSALKIHPPVPKCETQSHQDVCKMWKALMCYCSVLCICVVIIPDGQLTDLLRTEKRREPEEYKRILIGNGPFHSHSHFSFVMNEGYWKALLATFATEFLKKQKQIYEIMKDLQHDNAKHCLDFHRVSAAGIVAYLLLDVKQPPPRLLISDPRAYRALVRHAGGSIILTYLFFAAIPILYWQRMIRAGKGSEITMLYAYAFHCFGSLGRKFKSVFICMIALMGLRCAHPKLVKVLEATCVISFLGRTWIAKDRFLEYVNLLQQKRSTAFRGYDSQIQFSSLLKPLVHVDTAWKMADGQGVGIDDGIPEYLHHDVSAIRRGLRAKLGTDLTIVHAGNPLWHTGNAVPLDGGDYRERAPDDYVWAVCAGDSAGKGRKKRMDWKTWATAFVGHHWF